LGHRSAHLQDTWPKVKANPTSPFLAHLKTVPSHGQQQLLVLLRIQRFQKWFAQYTRIPHLPLKMVCTVHKDSAPTFKNGLHSTQGFRTYFKGIVPEAK
jgi:hypothetical protein